MSPIVEQKLAQWEPDHDDLTPIIRSILRPNMDIVGEWTAPVHRDYSSLSIRRKGAGDYSVSFSTGGCLGDWCLEREATYGNGVMRLSKPVQEYAPHTYDTLYPASVGGTEYLISQSGIRFLAENYSKKGVVDWSRHVKSVAYRRGSRSTPRGAAGNAGQ